MRAIGRYDFISSVGFPGFNISMNTTFVQSAGRLILLVQYLLHIKSSVSIGFGPRFLINSGNILSDRGCFLLLMFFIACLNLYCEFFCEQFFQVAISVCTLLLSMYLSFSSFGLVLICVVQGKRC